MLKELKDKKAELEAKITTLLREFENIVGEDSISSLSFERWNGSHTAFGRIRNCRVTIKI